MVILIQRAIENVKITDRVIKTGRIYELFIDFRYYLFLYSIIIILSILILMPLSYIRISLFVKQI